MLNYKTVLWTVCCSVIWMAGCSESDLRALSDDNTTITNPSSDINDTATEPGSDTNDTETVNPGDDTNDTTTNSGTDINDTTTGPGSDTNDTETVNPGTDTNDTTTNSGTDINDTTTEPGSDINDTVTTNPGTDTNDSRAVNPTPDTNDTAVTNPGVDTQETYVPVPVAPKLVGWYLKPKLQTTTFSDDHTVLGYLEGASDGKDQFDSEALSGSGSTYLYSTLYREDFTVQNYRSEYRARKSVGDASDTWVMKVYSSDPNAEVTVSWDDVVYVYTREGTEGYIEVDQNGSEEISSLILTDQDGSITLGTEKEYRFLMGGQKIRELHWTVGNAVPVSPAVTKRAKTAGSITASSAESAVEHKENRVDVPLFKGI